MGLGCEPQITMLNTPEDLLIYTEQNFSNLIGFISTAYFLLVVSIMSYALRHVS